MLVDPQKKVSKSLIAKETEARGSWDEAQSVCGGGEWGGARTQPLPERTVGR